jgi:hypothetical protein
MKTCEVCGNQIKSRRLKKCDRCYHKEWWSLHKPAPKVKIRSANCLECGKERERHGRSVLFCNSCALKRFYERHPEAKDKRTLDSRNYQRKKKGIDTSLPPLKKEHGQGCINLAGYKIISKRGHPNQLSKKGSIAEHTFIMSEYLKRPLKKNESVHHKNGIKNDNRIENLELRNTGQPSGQRVDDKIKWAKEFLEEYGFKIT